MIERITPPVSDADFRQLAELLAETVNAGGVVSFLAPLSVERAEAWWRDALERAHRGAIFLVAREGRKIVGTVQMHPAWAPNQPHRGDIAKLMVHRQGRRGGLGRQLMQRVEEEARRAGIRLLTLDTRAGDAAEHLYRNLGWTAVGTIPRFGLNNDGTMHDAVVFYKELV